VKILEELDECVSHMSMEALSKDYAIISEKPEPVEIMA